MCVGGRSLDFIIIILCTARLGTTTATATQCPSGHSSSSSRYSSAPDSKLRGATRRPPPPLPQTSRRRGRRHAIIARDSRGSSWSVLVFSVSFRYLHFFFYFLPSFFSLFIFFFISTRNTIIYKHAYSEITSTCCRNFPLCNLEIES